MSGDAPLRQTTGNQQLAARLRRLARYWAGAAKDAEWHGADDTGWSMRQEVRDLLAAADIVERSDG